MLCVFVSFVYRTFAFRRLIFLSQYEITEKRFNQWENGENIDIKSEYTFIRFKFLKPTWRL